MLDDGGEGVRPDEGIAFDDAIHASHTEHAGGPVSRNLRRDDQIHVECRFRVQRSIVCLAEQHARRADVPGDAALPGPPAALGRFVAPVLRVHFVVVAVARLRKVAAGMELRETRGVSRKTHP